jgi:hypothetical protein
MNGRSRTRKENPGFFLMHKGMFQYNYVNKVLNIAEAEPRQNLMAM